MAFDYPLKVTNVTTSNFALRWNNEQRVISGASVVNGELRVASAAAGPPDPGPDVITYYANPGNLRGAWSPFRRVLPFADFPIT